MKKSIYIFITILFAGIFSPNMYSYDAYDIFSPATSPDEANSSAGSYESSGIEEPNLLTESWTPYSSPAGIQLRSAATTSSPFADDNDWDNQLALGEELSQPTGNELPIGDELPVLFLYISIYALGMLLMRNKKKIIGCFK